MDTTYTYDLTVSIVTCRNDHVELMTAIEAVLNSAEIRVKLYVIDNSPTRELQSLFSL